MSVFAVSALASEEKEETASQADKGLNTIISTSQKERERKEGGRERERGREREKKRERDADSERELGQEAGWGFYVGVWGCN